jgi:hypothetical protein
MSDVTRVRNSIEHGDGRTAEELLPLAYDELREFAAAKRANEKARQALQATALLHGDEDDCRRGGNHRSLEQCSIYACAGLSDRRVGTDWVRLRDKRFRETTPDARSDSLLLRSVGHTEASCSGT